MLGLQWFINLSTNFYTRVYDDEEEWFRSMFSNSKKEDAIQNQYELGGPPLYSQRKGHPALIGRHRQFPVTHEAAERWLQHMQNALDDSLDIAQDSKDKMMNFFRHTAFFLVAGNELKNQNQNQNQNQSNQVACKHAANKAGEEQFNNRFLSYFTYHTDSRKIGFPWESYAREIELFFRWADTF